MIASHLTLRSMEPILLLHGALGAKEQLQPLARQIASDFDPHLLNFPGHGGTEGPAHFSIPVFAAAVLNYLDEMQIAEANIFGYSMGGYVAMYLAANYPERVKRVITLGTKYEWSEAIAGAETAMLKPEKMEEKVPKFAEQLRQRHAPHNWKEVVYKTSTMLQEMGTHAPLNETDMQRITAKALLLLGDSDKMVSFEETAHVYRLLSNGQFCVLPGTQHPIEKVDIETVCFLIKKFFASTANA